MTLPHNAEILQARGRLAGGHPRPGALNKVRCMRITDSALISIKPIFADAILSGAKTIELRRRIPALGIGTFLWIYATRPRAAVVGTAMVSAIIKGTPEEIWDACSDDAAIDRCTFDAYFDGSTSAFGIVLTEIVKREPVGFEKLKEIRGNFHPPQVLMRMTEQETLSLHKEAFKAG